MLSHELRNAIKNNAYELIEFYLLEGKLKEQHEYAINLIAGGFLIDTVTLDNGQRRRFFMDNGIVLVVDVQESEVARIVFGKMQYRKERFYVIKEMVLK